MKLSNVRRRVQSYALALLAFGVALAGTLLLREYLDRTIFILFWPAVLVATRYGGTAIGIVTALLSVLAVDYWIIPPIGGLSPTDRADLFQIVMFAVGASFVGVLTGSLESARIRAEDAAGENARLAHQLQEQQIEMETQYEEQQSLSEELENANEELMANQLELEETRDAALAAEHFVSEILGAISHPFVVHDADWHFRYINDAAAGVFAQSGHAAESLLGKVVWDAYPELNGTDFEREMRRAATERVRTTFEAYYPENATWSEVVCFPLREGGVATQWRDITDRKRAEETRRYLMKASEVLNESLDYTATLAKLAHLVVPELADWCGIEVADENGKLRNVAVAHVNPDKVKFARDLSAKYPPDPNAASGAPNVYRTGQPELYESIPQELLEAGAQDAEHLRLIRALGLRSAIVVPLLAGERVLGVLSLISAESGRRYTKDDLELATLLARRAAIAVDNAQLYEGSVAARREAESERARADEANHAKTEFLRSMSHELRTPLNAIGGYTDLLLAGVRGTLNETQRTDLERINASQRHLLRLINDILNFAKVEAGRVEFEMRAQPVAQILDGIDKLVGPRLEAKGIEFVISPPADGASVYADTEKTRQILLNLLTNAVKFTPQGGRVRLRTLRRGDSVRISVEDTGIGIPADKLVAVFDPFVQVHRTRSDYNEGTGLGLAISRDLARGMGGDIEVESEVDRGSTFTLVLRCG